MGADTIDDSNWVVLKFGGTSVASRARWDTIARVVQRRRDEEGLRVLVVCSALSGVSNLLEKLIRHIGAGEEVDAGLGEIRARHEQFCDEMDVPRAPVEAYLGELERLVEGSRLIGMLTDEMRARIMASGELMSTTIGVHWLTRQGIEAEWRDARDMLEALPAPVEATQSRRYLSAACDSAYNPALVTALDGAAPVVITQGFIARDAHGQTVLLGRGGSDSSAAYFAAHLGARRLEIWTDVPGMFTTNPRDRADARLLRLLGYDEAQVLSAMGARVLHPRCLPPVSDADIPLHIRCTPAPEIEGTVISSEVTADAPHLKAVSTRHKLFMLRLHCPGHWHLAGLLSDVTTVFKRHGLSIDLIANSPQQISVTLDPAVTPMGPIERENLLRDLERYGELGFSQNVGSVSLIGSQIGAVFDQLASGLGGMAGSNIHLVNQASLNDGLSFVMDPEDVDRVANPLHDWLLAGPMPERIFGPSWAELSARISEATSR